jgi:single-strand DNA-binding protein
MASFNRVILAGNLTRDPQLSYTPSNVPVCEIGLATNRRFRDKDGNQRDEVCFVDLQAYGRTAATINQYFQKGKPILVEGRLRFREWTNQQGQKRNKLDVVIENFSFIDSGGGQQNGGQARGAPRQAPQADQQQSEPYYDDGPPPVDADIPF